MRKIFLVIICLLAGIAVGIQFGDRIEYRLNVFRVGGLRQPVEGQDKLSRLMGMIRTQYVDPVDMDSIVEAVMPQLVGVLDPHSVYIPAKDFAQANETLEGGFGGIGIKFNMITDTAIVSQVIAGGPSERAGLRIGDRIMRVDGRPIAGRKMAQDSVVGMLRGQLGTTVRLGMTRGGRPVEVDITRGQIPISSITAAFMIVPGVGYVKFDQFARTSADELRDAVTVLRRGGADRLVLDLRGNTGGYLDQAIKIANEFLDEGRMIVYTVNRAGERVVEGSDGRGRFKDMELVVVVDEQSASASEIVAGALQDNDRGTIVGRRTFGKGLVQEQMPFGDGSAVRLTVARYYTPTGRSIQKPYQAGHAGQYGEEIFRRYLHKEYFSADSIKFADSLKFTTPGGRTVYGGGGIMPDVFVPLDTTYMNRFYLGVLDIGASYRYALRWADRNRERLNAVTTVEGLAGLLDGDKDLWDGFVRFAAGMGLHVGRDESERARKVLEALLRAEIGRDTRLDGVGFWSQYWVEDQALRVAVEKAREKK